MITTLQKSIWKKCWREEESKYNKGYPLLYLKLGIEFMKCILKSLNIQVFPVLQLAGGEFDEDLGGLGEHLMAGGQQRVVPQVRLL